MLYYDIHSDMTWPETRSVYPKFDSTLKHREFFENEGRNGQTGKGLKMQAFYIMVQ